MIEFDFGEFLCFGGSEIEIRKGVFGYWSYGVVGWDGVTFGEGEGEEISVDVYSFLFR